MIKQLCLIFVILFSAVLANPANAQSGCDGSGNCYVRAAASGAGTGADWTNAYTGFGTAAGQANPASLIRGVTYFVAGGSYNTSTTTTFITPASGTTLITILAPTIASHGTATGWSNAYQAQAAFGPILVASSYWHLTGAYRGSGTGLPATDWRTGYGFKVNNSNGSGGKIGASGIWVGDSSPDEADHVTVEYFEVQGSGDITGTVNDGGIVFNFAQFPIILHNYVHDTGLSTMGVDSITTDIIEYNWIMNNQSCVQGISGCTSGHSEGVAIRGMNNLTFAYNILENIEGTGYIGTPCPSSTANACWGFAQDEWDFYGNIFFANTSEWHGNCASGCTRTGNQNGLSTDFIQFFGSANDQQIFSVMKFVNNTIYAIGGDASSNGPGQCDASNSVSTSTKVISFVFQNNIGGNCLKVGMPNLGSGSIGTGTLVQDHNTYCNVGTITDTGAALQTLATCALLNSPTTNDFSLAFDTSAWTPLSSPFNVDILGNTRTSSRGAFQAGGPAAAVSFLWSGTVNPSTVLLGSFPVTTASSAQTVTLCNGSISTGGVCTASTVTLTISTMVLSGINSGDFLFTTSPSGGNDCGGSLAAGATCVISFTINPSIIGPESATFTVTDSAGGSPQSFSVSGTGISQISVSPVSQSFGNIPVTTSSSELLMLVTNNGSTSVTSLAVSVSGTSASLYVIDTTSTTLGGISNCTKVTTLAASATCNAGVTFTPTAVGNNFAATLNFTDSAAGSPQTVPLSGNGMGSKPVVPNNPSAFAILRAFKLR